MTPFTSFLDRGRQHRQQQRQRFGISRHQQVRQRQQRPPINNRISRKACNNFFPIYCNLSRNKIIALLQFMMFSSVYFFALLRPDDSNFQLNTLRATFSNITMSNRSLLDSNENIKLANNYMSDIHFHEKKDITESKQVASFDKSESSSNRLENLIDINALIELKNKEELQLQSQQRKKRLEKMKKGKVGGHFLAPKTANIDNHINKTYGNEIISLNEDVGKQSETNNERINSRNNDEKKDNKESSASSNEKDMGTLSNFFDNEITVDYSTSESKFTEIDENGNETISFTQNDEDPEGFVSFFAFLCIIVTFRICLQMQTNQRFYNQMGFSTQFARTSSAVRQARYNILISRINQARIENGENPISPDLLLSILRRGRGDFDPNDYDDLLRLNEEAGPPEELLSSIKGLNTAEIERFPSRIIENMDDDLIILQQSNLMKKPQCAICLEHYDLDDKVRTLPCFHTFHCHCIDKWLNMKAECPVCKFATFC